MSRQAEVVAPPALPPQLPAPRWIESSAARYLLALGIGLAGIPAIATLGPLSPNAVFLVPGVVSIASIFLAGGFGPALLTATIAFVTTGYFLLEPHGAFAIHHPVERIQLAAGWLIYAVIAYVDGRARSERNRVRERERALKVSEWRYRMLLEQASDAILVVGADGRVEIANARTSQLLGRSEWDLLNRPVRELLGFSPPIPASDGAAAPPLLEQRITRADQTSFDAELTIRGLPDGRMQLIVRDVTARRQAEAEVRAERDLLDGILETGRAGILAIDAVTRAYLFVNRRLEEIARATREELLSAGLEGVGWHWFADGNPLTPDRWPSTRVIESRAPLSGEIILARREGYPELALQVSGAPLCDKDGAVRVVVLSVEDVTQRMTTERALRESEERLRRITNAMPGSVYQYRLTPDGRQSFEFVSRGILELLQLTPEETLQDFSKVWTMIVPADQDRLAKSILESARTLSRWHEVFQVKLADGTVKWIRGTSVPDPPGPDGTILWNGILLDITEQKRLEADLLQVQKMEGIGRLAGGIAHDFNNILTAIRGNIDLVLEDLASDDRHAPELNDVRDATERAAALTKQLLAFSRKQALQTRDLELNVLVRDVEKMLRRVIGEDVVLLTQPSDSLGLVRADAGQLEQVLLNLAVNARDAMPDGGLITLETRNVRVDAPLAESLRVPAGDYVSLVVRDTGHGMDSETKARIFDPFFTTKPAGKGTGLGLAMVYGIVRQSGGAITVDSEPERGATFRIYLPRVEPLATQVSATITPNSIPAILRRNASVLLVEDDAAVRTLVRRTLREAGYEVREAADAYAALTIAGPDCAGVDLVVTDVIMPGMGGRDLARELRLRRPDIRILFISGYLDIDLHKLGLDLRTRLLPKPFSRSLLLEHVSALLEIGRERGNVA